MDIVKYLLKVGGWMNWRHLSLNKVFPVESYALVISLFFYLFFVYLRLFYFLLHFFIHIHFNF